MNRMELNPRGAVSWSTAERLRALQQIVPKSSISAVLKRTQVGQRYCRRLPRWFVVWFVIALGMFCSDSYCQVFRWLQRFRRRSMPGRSTLCEARKSVGAAPLRLLADDIIQLQGREQDAHSFYAGLRLMAFDSFMVDIADTPANERAFGRHNGRTPSAFPQARVLSLCEVGTHILYRSLIKPHRRSEVRMAEYLLRFLRENMLVLWDRSFLSYLLVKRILSKKAQLLARVKSSLVFTPSETLKDGSFLSMFYVSTYDRQKTRRGIPVRIIEYTFHDVGRAGSGEKHRLLTTLLDADRHPAQQLIVLYHERWEEELAFDELKTHQRERAVLRSETPAGVIQELYGLLLGHYVIRRLMCEAAVTVDCEPRNISFVNTLKILRCRLPEVPRTTSGIRRWFRQLVNEVAEQRLPPRRNRVNPRVIKRKLSNWPKKQRKHYDSPQPKLEFQNAITILN